MANFTLDVRGFAAALDRASTAIVQEAQVAIERAAREASTQLTTTYPQRTGVLAGRVSARRGTARGSYDAGRIQGWSVFSRAPHAHLYEYGTGDRTDNTRRGARRGRMPARPLFGAILSDARRGLYTDVQRVLDQTRQV